MPDLVAVSADIVVSRSLSFGALSQVEQKTNSITHQSRNEEVK